MEPEFVGQAPEYGEVSGLVSFVGDSDLKFREREVLFISLSLEKTQSHFQVFAGGFTCI